MTERELEAIMRGIAPVLQEKFDWLATQIERRVQEAETTRVAEHRALMAEQRERQTSLLARVADLEEQATRP